MRRLHYHRRAGVVRSFCSAWILFWVAALPAADPTLDPPQAAPRGVPGARRVFRDSVTPHWFANDTRFWYRNELRGGSSEFIVVDAELSTRRPAFDHEAVAKKIGGDATASRLPIRELRFSDDGGKVTLIGTAKSWELNLTSGELREAPTVKTEARSLPADAEPRASSRTGPETQLTFDNRLGKTVEIFWIDTQGARQSYGKIAPGARKDQHTFGGHVWLVAGEQGETLAVFEATDTPGDAVIDGSRSDARERRPRRREREEAVGPSDRSPDGKWTAFIKEHNVFIKSRGDEAKEIQLSTDGREGQTYERPSWSPDSQSLAAFHVEPGERKEVYLVQSTPPGGGRAKLQTRSYALPGDKFTTSELNLFDMATRRQLKPDVDRFEHESQRPRLRWAKDGSRVSWSQTDRGHQRFRVIEVESRTGAARHLIDERSKTFLWTAHTESSNLQPVHWLDRSDEIIHVSESNGWRHLYLLDAKTGRLKNPITSGAWVVRGLDRIDETNRQVWFRASGIYPDQDPYLVHHGRVNFDGRELVWLTAGHGQHTVQFSPDRRFIIDTYSRVDLPPVSELRRASDGKLVCALEEADITALQENNWSAPEVFSAKGRDGQTDIWGILCRPRDFDPAKKYPVIEDIYAGPHGSFVPKTFSASQRYEALTKLGFVVVQIDGMGTANRSKAFHDVCWQNLKDGGFPDRIAWMKAAATTRPWMDITRVGIYGTSAGGQNAAGAVLFHPEFYKAAVANCGCHDNRMDKASWNEQWMGVPVGPHYAECSNIDNAHRLRGKLFLIVGELDSNVPPESTYRFVDALVKAGKDFDFLLVPNGGHGAGGSYAARRREDFFVRHLLGQEPPDRNAN